MCDDRDRLSRRTGKTSFRSRRAFGGYVLTEGYRVADDRYYTPAAPSPDARERGYPPISEEAYVTWSEFPTALKLIGRIWFYGKKGSPRVPVPVIRSEERRWDSKEKPCMRDRSRRISQPIRRRRKRSMRQRAICPYAIPRQSRLLLSL